MQGPIRRGERPEEMTKIRVWSRLRVFLEGTEPDRETDTDLYDLVDLIGGAPASGGIEIPEHLWSDLWYYADLLLSLEPDGEDRRACNAAMNDLEAAGYRSSSLRF
jgi:hypothetical protein